jgi:hypothetical protein
MFEKEKNTTLPAPTIHYWAYVQGIGSNVVKMISALNVQ